MIEDDDDLEELYKELVLEHSKKPRNFGTLEFSYHSKGKNPSCGDEISLYVQIDQDKKFINDVKFTGQGCALCIASSSFLTQAIKKQSVIEAQYLTNQFIDFIIEKQPLEEKYEPLHIFQGVQKYPLRVKCALLPWRTLQDILKNNGDKNE